MTSLFSRLQKLNKEATEGPWSWMGCGEKDNSWALGVAVNPATEQPLTGSIDVWEAKEYDLGNEEARALVIEMVAENPASNAQLTDAALIVECRNSLPAVLNLIEAAQRFIEDVDDALSDDPSGHDAYVRIGARFQERHEKRLREAVAVFVSGQEPGLAFVSWQMKGQP